MHDLDREQLKDAVKALLKTHEGPEAAITMTELYARVTGAVVIPWRRYDQTRLIRSVVEQLRREGCPIGLKGGPAGGYFWARNDEELKGTIGWFHERAMSALKQEAQLKRLHPGELIRQYEIELKETSDA